MATYYLADVKDVAEHKALQESVKHYPDCSYDAWQHLRDKEIANLLSGHHKVWLVEATAGEFIDYCERTGSRRDIDAFTGFLWDRGKRLKFRCSRVA